MAERTITDNGVNLLEIDERHKVSHFIATTVMVISNIDGAALTFGFVDDSDSFVAFPSGVISDGAKINHGKGCKLAVSVSGITGNPVKLSIFSG